MKPDTIVWIKCESVGRPECSITIQGTVRECIKAQTEWLLGVYMGSKIRITWARDEVDLGADRRSAAKSDIMADLESVLSGQEESDGHSS